MATRRLRQGLALQQGLFQPVPAGPRWEALPEETRVLVTTLVSRMLSAYRDRTAGDDRAEVHHA
jgi:hypothetical protein